MLRRWALLAGGVLIVVSPALAATGDGEPLFRDVAPSAALAAAPRDGTWEAPLPARFRTLEVDRAALSSALASAPAERSTAPPLVLALPYPDGGERRFRVEESPILAPELAARFPEIRTFVAKGVDDPTATARLSLTALGFHAMVLSASGTMFLDPYRRWDDRYVIAYWKRDARRAGPPMHCDVHAESDGAPGAGADVPPPAAALASGTQLRTYRLALAATGEYSAAVCAPNPAAVSCAMSAMAVSMNRVDGIYGREVAIRMVLVANDDLLVYTDGATDPYTNDDGATMLGENQANVDAVIGTANYDIGHVFSTGGGGIADLRVPCNASFKAEGVTGSSNPVGDGFDVDYVAHEMGHQWGANHTFNGTSGFCNGNRNASTAYEPGSGSTIMAYAGICDADDLQPHSDDTFHTKSYDEIVAYSTTGTGNTCAVKTATGNTPPTVNAGASFTIPKQTPFTLTGSGSDVDPTASLTYMWEELDLGSAAPRNDDVAAVRPIFRSFVPLTVPSRTFPQLSDILANTATFGESMSTRNRTMTFRLTVRDNQVGGGGVNYAATTVTVDAAAGPFAVTGPNAAVTWHTATTHTVTWNVANTTAAPVSCASVAIDLSTDGGNSFPISLSSSTPNDGAQNVTLPATPTSQARVRVRCVGNAFFDIDDADFTLESPQLPFADGFEDGTVDAWDGATH